MSNLFDPEVLEFMIGELQTCGSPDTLLACMTRATRLIGAANFSYHSDSDSVIRPSDRQSFFTYEEGWARRYIGREYEQIDPVVVMRPRAPTPQDWAILRSRRPGTDWLFREADSYGVGTHGITIPVSSSSGEGVFSITANCSDREWQRARWIYCAYGTVFAMHLHEKLVSLTEAKLGRRTPSFSERQLQCLRLYAWGYTAKEIATKLEISDTMVRRHLHASKSKLDCETLTEALAKATSLRIVGPR